MTFQLPRPEPTNFIRESNLPAILAANASKAEKELEELKDDLRRYPAWEHWRSKYLLSRQALAKRDEEIRELLDDPKLIEYMVEIFRWAIDTGPMHIAATPEKAIEQILKPLRAALNEALPESDDEH